MYVREFRALYFIKTIQNPFDIRDVLDLISGPRLWSHDAAHYNIHNRVYRDIRPEIF